MLNPHRIVVIIAVITFIAIGLSIPQGYPVKFNLFGYSVDRELEPLTLDINTSRVQIYKAPETVLGLDIAGGVRLVYETDMNSIAADDQESALDGVRNVIERRVNLFGVTEPTIQSQTAGDKKRIVVELPGVTDVDQAKNLIGKTAQLSFREFIPDEQTVATLSAQYSIPTFENTIETGLTGKDLKRSQVTFDQNSGEPVVSLEFTEEGAKLFEEITTRNVRRNLPVFIDEIPITSPVVNQAISGGSAIISGGFTSEKAKELSVQLNSGALPVPITVVEEKEIGPSLGQKSVEKSIKAGLIGLIAVMIFMWAYYGKLGFLANIALIIYGLITFAIFRLIPITLTLPGIAGFILSIGMAVDANILIFERIKEEQRAGRVWKEAMEIGFGRAWDSIRDANVTTLLTCFILFNPLNWDFLPQFGLARGFAATLAIGIIVGLFTGVFVSRNLIRVFIKK